jgi:hypothetical protein
MARRQLPRGGGGGRGGRGGALTGDRAAVKWSGDGGKVAVTKARGGEVQCERGGKEGGVGCGEMRRSWGAFYKCRGGGRRLDSGWERSMVVERRDVGGGGRFGRGSAEE